MLQALPSVHGELLATFSKTHPTPASQLSLVQALLSSQVRGPVGVQTPATQRSPSEHAFESEHGVLFARFEVVQPVEGLQPSEVHGLPSLHAREEP